MQDEEDEAEAEAGSKSAAAPAEDSSVGTIVPESKATAPEDKGRKKGPKKTQKAAKSKADDVSKGQVMVSEEDGMCTAILSVPLDSPPLLMQELAESAAAKSFVRYTQGEPARELIRGFVIRDQAMRRANPCRPSSCHAHPNGSTGRRIAVWATHWASQSHYESPSARTLLVLWQCS